MSWQLKAFQYRNLIQQIHSVWVTITNYIDTLALKHKGNLENRIPLKLGHSIKTVHQQIHTKNKLLFCRIKARKTLHMLQAYYMYLHGSSLGI